MSEPLAPPSFGGGRLEGTRVVRVVYMDEAGAGNEPIFIVAAALTSPDEHWHKLRRHYVDMANDIFYEREEPFQSYVFHAKDVWHGSGDFDRKRWSLQERMVIMKRLAQVPAAYEIPICLGIVNKAEVAEAITGKKNIRLIEHAMAYHMALQVVDDWMEENCPGEVAMVIAEDRDEVRQTIRDFHRNLQKTDIYDDYYDRGALVTKTIVDEVQFAAKDRSPILQLADTCAFLARRCVIERCAHARKHWNEIDPWLVKKEPTKNVRMRVPLSEIELAP